MPAMTCSSNLPGCPSPPWGPNLTPSSRGCGGARPSPCRSAAERGNALQDRGAGTEQHKRSLVCQALAFRDDMGKVGSLPSSAAEAQHKTARTTRKEYCNASLCFTHSNYGNVLLCCLQSVKLSFTYAPGKTNKQIPKARSNIS